MLFCATMMLDVLVGVVIEGFRVSTKGPDQPPAETLTAAAAAAAAATAPPPSEGTGAAAKNESSGAGSDSGGDLDLDCWDGGTSSGNSVGGDEESTAKGELSLKQGI